MAKKQDTISIGFEEKIWKAADILRGSLDASQYKGVVLGLIFLKYISDRFDQKFQELQGDEYADPEIRTNTLPRTSFSCLLKPDGARLVLLPTHRK